MSIKAIVYLKYDQPPLWAKFDATENILLEQGEDSLASIAEKLAGYYTVVLIPSGNVYLTQVRVPTSNAAKLRTAIPNLLEEAFSEDIESLHFAVGKPLEPRLYPVATIAKSRMEYYRNLLTEAGIDASGLMPAVLALPYTEGSWTLWQDRGELLVRNAVCQGFACGQAHAALFFQSILKQDDTETEPVLNTFQEGVALPSETGLVVEQQPPVSLMQMFIMGLQQNLGINLFQGGYQVRRKKSPTWQKWKITVVLASIAAVFWLAANVLNIYQLHQQNQKLTAEIEQVFNRTFPGTRMVNPRVQMQQALSKLQRQPSEEKTFLSELNHITQGFEKVSTISVTGLKYRNERFEFEIQAPNLKSLDTLKAAMADNGIEIEIVSARTEQGVVNGKIRVK